MNSDDEDPLTIELDMKSGKFFDINGEIHVEVTDWLRDTIVNRVTTYKDYKSAFSRDERVYLIEYISTTGITCAYITFTRRSDVTMFKMAWGGVLG